MKRLLWIDVAKGLAICFVVYFHFYRTVFEHYQAPPADWSGTITAAITIARQAWLQISELGFHAVGAFIVLSGWAVMQSMIRRAEGGPVAWKQWYLGRFARLYPMYWVAHLIYLVSPFIARFEPVDGRFALSFFGLRFINIGMTFYYLNASWWYFSMLIQFYLIFPLLYWAARRLGASIFLLTATALGFFVRYLLLDVYHAGGAWILGGLALSRLPEFGLGMALAMWHARSANRLEAFLLRGAGFVAGLILYPLALKLYHNATSYIFCDFATGACCFLVIVGLAGVVIRFGRFAQLLAVVGMYSYGLYLIHQPYVIWLGLRIRPLPISIFLLIFVITLAVLSAWGIILEKNTNRLVNRLLPAKSRPTVDSTIRA